MNPTPPDTKAHHRPPDPTHDPAPNPTHDQQGNQFPDPAPNPSHDQRDTPAGNGDPAPNPAHHRPPDPTPDPTHDQRDTPAGDGDPAVIRPDPDDARLTRRMIGTDHNGNDVALNVVEEKPLTIFLNDQEIVTVMTIRDYPEYLALGYLINQNMIEASDTITAIDYDAEIETIIVRTTRKTDYEKKMRKKIRTSGCAVGTVFGDVMEKFEDIVLDRAYPMHRSWITRLSKAINTMPSLYLKAGAIHGCVLCRGDRPLIYMEDVGRHNAVDKIAGYMFLKKVRPHDKIFYTTGRLTSEMVIKTVQMEIPVLISRSGFTAWGVELARQADLTLIGRARGKRFTVLSGMERIIDRDHGTDPADAPTDTVS